MDLELKSHHAKYTEIGPVRDVKIFCHHGRHGIEIKIPSTSEDSTNVWVEISRGPNRYVDELRYRDPENSLKQLITNACRTGVKSNRLFNWNCLTNTFQFLNGYGKTSLPMNSVPDTRGNLRYKIEQFVGN